jgi:hypothetical protein
MIQRNNKKENKRGRKEKRDEESQITISNIIKST